MKKRTSPRQKDTGEEMEITGIGGIMVAEAKNSANSTYAITHKSISKVPRQKSSCGKPSILRERILDLLAQNPQSDERIFEIGRFSDVKFVLGDLCRSPYPHIKYEIRDGKRIWFLNARGEGQS